MHIIQQFQDMSGQNKLTLLIYVWKINSFIKWQIHNINYSIIILKNKKKLYHNAHKAFLFYNLFDLQY